MYNNKVECGVCGATINLKKLTSYRVTMGITHCKGCVVDEDEFKSTDNVMVF